MLQKLKLMFDLELIAIQRNTGLISAELAAGSPATKARMVEVAGAARRAGTSTRPPN